MKPQQEQVPSNGRPGSEASRLASGGGLRVSSHNRGTTQSTSRTFSRGGAVGRTLTSPDAALGGTGGGGTGSLGLFSHTQFGSNTGNMVGQTNTLSGVGSGLGSPRGLGFTSPSPLVGMGAIPSARKVPVTGALGYGTGSVPSSPLAGHRLAGPGWQGSQTHGQESSINGSIGLGQQQQRLPNYTMPELYSGGTFSPTTAAVNSTNVLHPKAKWNYESLSRTLSGSRGRGGAHGRGGGGFGGGTFGSSSNRLNQISQLPTPTSSSAGVGLSSRRAPSPSGALPFAHGGGVVEVESEGERSSSPSHEGDSIQRSSDHRRRPRAVPTTKIHVTSSFTPRHPPTTNAPSAGHLQAISGGTMARFPSRANLGEVSTHGSTHPHQRPAGAGTEGVGMVSLGSPRGPGNSGGREMATSLNPSNASTPVASKPPATPRVGKSFRNPGPRLNRNSAPASAALDTIGIRDPGRRGGAPRERFPHDRSSSPAPGAEALSTSVFGVAAAAVGVTRPPSQAGLGTRTQVQRRREIEANGTLLDEGDLFTLDNDPNALLGASGTDERARRPPKRNATWAEEDEALFGAASFRKDTNNDGNTLNKNYSSEVGSSRAHRDTNRRMKSLAQLSTTTKRLARNDDENKKSRSTISSVDPSNLSSTALDTFAVGGTGDSGPLSRSSPTPSCSSPAGRNASSTCSVSVVAISTLLAFLCLVISALVSTLVPFSQLDSVPIDSYITSANTLDRTVAALASNDVSGVVVTIHGVARIAVDRALLLHRSLEVFNPLLPRLVPTIPAFQPPPSNTTLPPNNSTSSNSTNSTSNSSFAAAAESEGAKERERMRAKAFRPLEINYTDDNETISENATFGWVAPPPSPNALPSNDSLGNESNTRPFAADYDAPFMMDPEVLKSFGASQLASSATTVPDLTAPIREAIFNPEYLKLVGDANGFGVPSSRFAGVTRYHPVENITAAHIVGWVSAVAKSMHNSLSCSSHQQYVGQERTRKGGGFIYTSLTEEVMMINDTDHIVGARCDGGVGVDGQGRPTGVRVYAVFAHNASLLKAVIDSTNSTLKMSAYMYYEWVVPLMITDYDLPLALLSSPKVTIPVSALGSPNAQEWKQQATGHNNGFRKPFVFPSQSNVMKAASNLDPILNSRAFIDTGVDFSTEPGNLFLRVPTADAGAQLWLSPMRYCSFVVLEKANRNSQCVSMSTQFSSVLKKDGGSSVGDVIVRNSNNMSNLDPEAKAVRRDIRQQDASAVTNTSHSLSNFSESTAMNLSTNETVFGSEQISNDSSSSETVLSNDTDSATTESLITTLQSTTPSNPTTSRPTTTKPIVPTTTKAAGALPPQQTTAFPFYGIVLGIGDVASDGLNNILNDIRDTLNQESKIRNHERGAEDYGFDGVDTEAIVIDSSAVIYGSTITPEGSASTWDMLVASAKSSVSPEYPHPALPNNIGMRVLEEADVPFGQTLMGDGWSAYMPGYSLLALERRRDSVWSELSLLYDIALYPIISDALQETSLAGQLTVAREALGDYIYGLKNLETSGLVAISLFYIDTALDEMESFRTFFVVFVALGCAGLTAIYAIISVVLLWPLTKLKYAVSYWAWQDRETHRKRALEAIEKSRADELELYGPQIVSDSSTSPLTQQEEDALTKVSGKRDAQVLAENIDQLPRVSYVNRFLRLIGLDKQTKDSRHGSNSSEFDSTSTENDQKNMLRKIEDGYGAARADRDVNPLVRPSARGALVSHEEETDAVPVLSRYPSFPEERVAAISPPHDGGENIRGRANNEPTAAIHANTVVATENRVGEGGAEDPNTPPHDRIAQYDTEDNQEAEDDFSYAGESGEEDWGSDEADNKDINEEEDEDDDEEEKERTDKRSVITEEKRALDAQRKQAYEKREALQKKIEAETARDPRPRNGLFGAIYTPLCIEVAKVRKAFWLLREEIRGNLQQQRAVIRDTNDVEVELGLREREVPITGNVDDESFEQKEEEKDKLSASDDYAESQRGEDRTPRFTKGDTIRTEEDRFEASTLVPLISFGQITSGIASVQMADGPSNVEIGLQYNNNKGDNEKEGTAATNEQVKPLAEGEVFTTFCVALHIRLKTSTVSASKNTKLFALEKLSRMRREREALFGVGPKHRDGEEVTQSRHTSSKKVNSSTNDLLDHKYGEAPLSVFDTGFFNENAWLWGVGDVTKSDFYKCHHVVVAAASAAAQQNVKETAAAQQGKRVVRQASMSTLRLGKEGLQNSPRGDLQSASYHHHGHHQNMAPFERRRFGGHTMGAALGGSASVDLAKGYANTTEGNSSTLKLDSTLAGSMSRPSAPAGMAPAGSLSVTRANSFSRSGGNNSYGTNNTTLKSNTRLGPVVGTSGLGRSAGAAATMPMSSKHFGFNSTLHHSLKHHAQLSGVSNPLQGSSVGGEHSLLIATTGSHYSLNFGREVLARRPSQVDGVVSASAATSIPTVSSGGGRNSGGKARRAGIGTSAFTIASALLHDESDTQEGLFEVFPKTAPNKIEGQACRELREKGKEERNRSIGTLVPLITHNSIGSILKGTQYLLCKEAYILREMANEVIPFFGGRIVEANADGLVVAFCVGKAKVLPNKTKEESTVETSTDPLQSAQGNSALQTNAYTNNNDSYQLAKSTSNTDALRNALLCVDYILGRYVKQRAAHMHSSAQPTEKPRSSTASGETRNIEASSKYNSRHRRRAATSSRAGTTTTSASASERYQTNSRNQQLPTANGAGHRHASSLPPKQRTELTSAGRSASSTQKTSRSAEAAEDHFLLTTATALTNRKRLRSNKGVPSEDIRSLISQFRADAPLSLPSLPIPNLQNNPTTIQSEEETESNAGTQNVGTAAAHKYDYSGQISSASFHNSFHHGGDNNVSSISGTPRNHFEPAAPPPREEDRTTSPHHNNKTTPRSERMVPPGSQGLSSPSTNTKRGLPSKKARPAQGNTDTDRDDVFFRQPSQKRQCPPSLKPPLFRLSEIKNISIAMDASAAFVFGVGQASNSKAATNEAGTTAAEHPTKKASNQDHIKVWMDRCFSGEPLDSLNGPTVQVNIESKSTEKSTTTTTEVLVASSISRVTSLVSAQASNYGYIPVVATDAVATLLAESVQQDIDMRVHANSHSFAPPSSFSSSLAQKDREGSYTPPNSTIWNLATENSKAAVGVNGEKLKPNERSSRLHKLIEIGDNDRTPTEESNEGGNASLMLAGGANMWPPLSSSYPSISPAIQKASVSPLLLARATSISSAVSATPSPSTNTLQPYRAATGHTCLVCPFHSYGGEDGSEGCGGEDSIKKEFLERLMLGRELKRAELSELLESKRSHIEALANEERLISQTLKQLKKAKKRKNKNKQIAALSLRDEKGKGEKSSASPSTPIPIHVPSQTLGLGGFAAYPLQLSVASSPYSNSINHGMRRERRRMMCSGCAQDTSSSGADRSPKTLSATATGEPIPLHPLGESVIDTASPSFSASSSSSSLSSSSSGYPRRSKREKENKLGNLNPTSATSLDVHDDTSNNNSSSDTDDSATSESEKKERKPSKRKGLPGKKKIAAKVFFSSSSSNSGTSSPSPRKSPGAANVRGSIISSHTVAHIDSYGGGAARLPSENGESGRGDLDGAVGNDGQLLPVIRGIAASINTSELTGEEVKLEGFGAEGAKGTNAASIEEPTTVLDRRVHPRKISEKNEQATPQIDHTLDDYSKHSTRKTEQETRQKKSKKSRKNNAKKEGSDTRSLIVVGRHSWQVEANPLSSVSSQIVPTFSRTNDFYLNEDEAMGSLPVLATGTGGNFSSSPLCADCAADAEFNSVSSYHTAGTLPPPTASALCSSSSPSSPCSSTRSQHDGEMKSSAHSSCSSSSSSGSFANSPQCAPHKTAPIHVNTNTPLLPPRAPTASPTHAAPNNKVPAIASSSPLVLSTATASLGNSSLELKQRRRVIRMINKSVEKAKKIALAEREAIRNELERLSSTAIIDPTSAPTHAFDKFSMPSCIVCGVVSATCGGGGGAPIDDVCFVPIDWVGAREKVGAMGRDEATLLHAVVTPTIVTLTEQYAQGGTTGLDENMGLPKCARGTDFSAQSAAAETDGCSFLVNLASSQAAVRSVKERKGERDRDKQALASAVATYIKSVRGQGPSPALNAALTLLQMPMPAERVALLGVPVRICPPRKRHSSRASTRSSSASSSSSAASSTSTSAVSLSMYFDNRPPLSRSGPLPSPTKFEGGKDVKDTVLDKKQSSSFSPNLSARSRQSLRMPMMGNNNDININRENEDESPHRVSGEVMRSDANTGNERKDHSKSPLKSKGKVDNLQPMTTAERSSATGLSPFEASKDEKKGRDGGGGNTFVDGLQQQLKAVVSPTMELNCMRTMPAAIANSEPHLVSVLHSERYFSRWLKGFLNCRTDTDDFNSVHARLGKLRKQALDFSEVDTDAFQHREGHIFEMCGNGNESLLVTAQQSARDNFLEGSSAAKGETGMLQFQPLLPAHHRSSVNASKVLLDTGTDLETDRALGSPPNGTLLDEPRSATVAPKDMGPSFSSSSGVLPNDAAEGGVGEGVTNTKGEEVASVGTVAVGVGGVGGVCVGILTPGAFVEVPASTSTCALIMPEKANDLLESATNTGPASKQPIRSRPFIPMLKLDQVGLEVDEPSPAAKKRGGPSFAFDANRVGEEHGPTQLGGKARRSRRTIVMLSPSADDALRHFDTRSNNRSTTPQHSVNTADTLKNGGNTHNSNKRPRGTRVKVLFDAVCLTPAQIVVSLQLNPVALEPPESQHLDPQLMRALRGCDNPYCSYLTPPSSPTRGLCTTTARKKDREARVFLPPGSREKDLSVAGVGEAKAATRTRSSSSITGASSRSTGKRSANDETVFKPQSLLHPSAAGGKLSPRHEGQTLSSSPIRGKARSPPTMVPAAIHPTSLAFQRTRYCAPPTSKSFLNDCLSQTKPFGVLFREKRGSAAQERMKNDQQAPMRSVSDRLQVGSWSSIDPQRIASDASDPASSAQLGAPSGTVERRPPRPPLPFPPPPPQSLLLTHHGTGSSSQNQFNALLSAATYSPSTPSSPKAGQGSTQRSEGSEPRHDNQRDEGSTYFSFAQQAVSAGEQDDSKYGAARHFADRNTTATSSRSRELSPNDRTPSATSGSNSARTFTNKSPQQTGTQDDGGDTFHRLARANGNQSNVSEDTNSQGLPPLASTVSPPRTPERSVLFIQQFQHPQHDGQNCTNAATSADPSALGGAGSPSVPPLQLQASTSSRRVCFTSDVIPATLAVTVGPCPIPPRVMFLMILDAMQIGDYATGLFMALELLNTNEHVKSFTGHMAEAAAVEIIVAAEKAHRESVHRRREEKARQQQKREGYRSDAAAPNNAPDVRLASPPSGVHPSRRPNGAPPAGEVPQTTGTLPVFAASNATSKIPRNINTTLEASSRDSHIPALHVMSSTHPRTPSPRLDATLSTRSVVKLSSSPLPPAQQQKQQNPLALAPSVAFAATAPHIQGTSAGMALATTTSTRGVHVNEHEITKEDAGSDSTTAAAAAALSPSLGHFVAATLLSAHSHVKGGGGGGSSMEQPQPAHPMPLTLHSQSQLASRTARGSSSGATSTAVHLPLMAHWTSALASVSAFPPPASNSSVPNLSQVKFNSAYDSTSNSSGIGGGGGGGASAGLLGGSSQERSSATDKNNSGVFTIRALQQKREDDNGTPPCPSFCFMRGSSGAEGETPSAATTPRLISRIPHPSSADLTSSLPPTTSSTSERGFVAVVAPLPSMLVRRVYQLAIVCATHVIHEETSKSRSGSQTPSLSSPISARGPSHSNRRTSLFGSKAAWAAGLQSLSSRFSRSIGRTRHAHRKTEEQGNGVNTKDATKNAATTTTTNLGKVDLANDSNLSKERNGQSREHSNGAVAGDNDTFTQKTTSSSKTRKKDKKRGKQIDKDQKDQTLSPSELTNDDASPQQVRTSKSGCANENLHASDQFLAQTLNFTASKSKFDGWRFDLDLQLDGAPPHDDGEGGGYDHQAHHHPQYMRYFKRRKHQSATKSAKEGPSPTNLRMPFHADTLPNFVSRRNVTTASTSTSATAMKASPRMGRTGFDEYSTQRSARDVCHLSSVKGVIGSNKNNNARQLLAEEEALFGRSLFTPHAYFAHFQKRRYQAANVLKMAEEAQLINFFERQTEGVTNVGQQQRSYVSPRSSFTPLSHSQRLSPQVPPPLPPTSTETASSPSNNNNNNWLLDYSAKQFRPQYDSYYQQESFGWEDVEMLHFFDLGPNVGAGGATRRAGGHHQGDREEDSIAVYSEDVLMEGWLPPEPLSSAAPTPLEHQLKSKTLRYPTGGGAPLAAATVSPPSGGEAKEPPKELSSQLPSLALGMPAAALPSDGKHVGLEDFNTKKVLSFDSKIMTTVDEPSPHNAYRIGGIGQEREIEEGQSSSSSTNNNREAPPPAAVSIVPAIIIMHNQSSSIPSAEYRERQVRVDTTAVDEDSDQLVEERREEPEVRGHPPTHVIHVESSTNAFEGKPEDDNHDHDDGDGDGQSNGNRSRTGDVCEPLREDQTAIQMANHLTKTTAIADTMGSSMMGRQTKNTGENGRSCSPATLDALHANPRSSPSPVTNRPDREHFHEEPSTDTDSHVPVFGGEEFTTTTTTSHLREENEDENDGDDEQHISGHGHILQVLDDKSVYGRGHPHFVDRGPRSVRSGSEDLLTCGADDRSTSITAGSAFTASGLEGSAHAHNESDGGLDFYDGPPLDMRVMSTCAGGRKVSMTNHTQLRPPPLSAQRSQAPPRLSVTSILSGSASQRLQLAYQHPAISSSTPTPKTSKSHLFPPPSPTSRLLSDAFGGVHSSPTRKSEADSDTSTAATAPTSRPPLSPSRRESHSSAQ